MARRSIAVHFLLILCLLSIAACGLKAPPRPRSQLVPGNVRDLKAVTKPDGIELTFSVPQYDEPGRKVVEVELHYGFLPLTGNPECPPCPPLLRNERTLSLLGDDNTLMEGGQFKYLDTTVPMNKDAYYQVVLTDAAGRHSEASNLGHAPRVTPPAAPAGLVVEAGENLVKLSWQEAELVPAKGDEDGLLGWVVFRKDADGEKQLVTRPLTKPELTDKTVSNGQTYSYQVAAVQKVEKAEVTGTPTDWVEAAPKDMTPPSAPLDLVAGSSSQGIHVRFTPSPDKDIAGYLVFRATQKSGPWTQVGEMSLENAITDSNVKENQQYYYQVQAVDEAGNKSEMSAVIDLKHLP